MIYLNGPLEVTRLDDDFHFFIEIGQGAKHQVHASPHLEESVAHLLKKSHVPAFHRALVDLQELGRQTDWQWFKIVNQFES